MTYTYTRTDLIASLNRYVHNKQGLFIDINATCNDSVRDVLSEVDLRTARRKYSLVPNLFSKEYEYVCPTDLKATALIDIIQQARREDKEFNLVPSQNFRVKAYDGDVSFDDYNGTRLLLINSLVNDKSVVLSELDSTTSGGGTWTATGDATNLEADTDDYYNGNGSLRFGLGSGGATTAGIKNTTLSVFDFANYLNGNGAIFVWAKINSISDLTSFTLKIGSDTSNYYSKTVTVKNDGTAFIAGWNLLRFDMSSLTTTGTPVKTSFKYVEIFMNKATTKINETYYKFDYIVAKVGKNAELEYYSKYGWQSSSGAYKENSTTGSDYVVADTDEYNLIVKKAVSNAKRELNYPEGEIVDADKEYEKAKMTYVFNNPSEAKIIGTQYYDY